MNILPRTRTFSELRPLPLEDVQITDGFWSQKQRMNRDVTLRHGYQMLEQAGNLNNLRLVTGEGEGEFAGRNFHDSDIYKWLQAVALDLVHHPDRELEEMANEVIDLLEAAQQEDGYLGSYYTVVEPEKRWADLDHGHELYMAGHLFEAAVAHHRATGDDRLLNVARRFANHIDHIFGEGKREGAPGHPEVELALVELYRETGDERYLRLASFFVDQRGKGTMRGHDGYGPEYHQDRVPVRDAQEVEGHAVRQLYLATGMVDLYLETGDQSLLQASERLWHDMVAHKMYVTGGLGARYRGESFGDAYELPSDQAYAETCAAIGSMMWSWRMLLATGDVSYADLIERTLYNGFLSGVSLAADCFFYVNPLQSHGGVERQPWYPVACCPPNVMRQIAAVGHYVATTDEAGIQLHQYMAATVNGTFGEGHRVRLHLETDYPWDGRVDIHIEEVDESAGEWTLSLRVPAWCEGAQVAVNGEPLAIEATAGSYATVRRAWQAGDAVRLSLPIEPTLIAPHPRIDAIRGSVAIQRGPLIYCFEEVDQPAGTNLLDLRLDPDAPLRDSYREDLVEGAIVVVEAGGVRVEPGAWEGELYHPLAEAAQVQEVVTLVAVPYYVWANRGAGPMRVWIPTL